ncbi:hypothetical protein [Streptomyces sp. NP-1717]|uniref:hypothetical protein n=1 Tax=Streptomyces sp. NP-1717 TaxID=2704470 RepID=UPI001F5D0855|nr:hypothetical protein [Streptomyces sp. NP-1717]MCI3224326.1 hypothetical protein [Streptomyces sp. NP-1717]
MDETVEPRWMIVANVVRWRRYGAGGQELRPGTKVYRGGARVFVISTYPGMGNEDLTTVGQARNTGHWITIDMPTRHLHTFRAKLTYSPAVLRRAGQPFEPPTEERARETAAALERLAARYRRESHAGVAHPRGCLCHECLTAADGTDGTGGTGGAGPVSSA